MERPAQPDKPGAADRFGHDSTGDEVLAGTSLARARVLVTGVSSGLGLETARALTAHGAEVVGTVRDLARGQAETSAIQAGAAAAGGMLRLADLDLASLASVCALADRLAAEDCPFDLVIANAGIMACPQTRTADGFELQLGTNHLGHFMLANRIRPLHASGPAPGGPEFCGASFQMST